MKEGEDVIEEEEEGEGEEREEIDTTAGHREVCENILNL